MNEQHQFLTCFTVSKLVQMTEKSVCVWGGPVDCSRTFANRRFGRLSTERSHTNCFPIYGNILAEVLES